MSAHIPEFRRAVAGRTHAQTWQPEAVEITRRSFLREAVSYVAFVLFVLVMLFGLHLVARFA